MIVIGMKTQRLYAFHFDELHRNPQADLQAMDRAHRIGQTKQVYVFRFITEVSGRHTKFDDAYCELPLI
jgi:hypothetical protein